MGGQYREIFAGWLAWVSKQTTISLAIGCATALAVGCGGNSPSAVDEGAGSTVTEPPVMTVEGPEPKVPLPKGAPPKKLVVNDLQAGTGTAAVPGDELTTQFVAVYLTGKRFESSWEKSGKPFSFRLGAEESSPAWERGLRGMRVGGRRELIVPPNLSSRFGTPAGSGPEDTLVYVIELIDLHRSGSAGGGDVPSHTEPTLTAPKAPPPKELVVKDLIKGNGRQTKTGDELTVEYAGIHYNGSQFTNSWTRSKPFKFLLGSESRYLNPGWEKGIPGMRVGGRRELIVPPKLLYWSGAPPGSKPSDALVYVIDLLAIE